ncbi:hypothetical protein U9M48_040815 [Paspalum notatum var. saurae]|uniref:Cytochrome P450 n=1 Tax=Paspalum notatum var. saurae TaxID=547442 RepID=A0AAQ3URB9_PASNO
MAAELSPYLLLLPLLALPLLALALRSRAHGGTRDDAAVDARLPPGPWAPPIIGHLHHLAGSTSPPHHALRDLARRHGPLMLLRLGRLPVVVASSAAAAREVTRDHDAAFASRPVAPALRRRGPRLRALRRGVAPHAPPRRVRSFRAAREAELRRLLRAVAAVADAAGEGEPRPANLTRLVSAFVSASAVRAVVGSRRERHVTFLHCFCSIPPVPVVPRGDGEGRRSGVGAAAGGGGGRDAAKTGQKKNSGAPTGPIQRLLESSPRWSSCAAAFSMARNAHSKRSTCCSSFFSSQHRPVNHSSSATASDFRIPRSSPPRSSTRRLGTSSILSALVLGPVLAPMVASRKSATFLRALEDALGALPRFSLQDLFPPSRLAVVLSRAARAVERRRRAMGAGAPGLDAILDSLIREHQEHQEMRDAAAAAPGGGVRDNGDDEDLLDVLLRLQKESGSQYPLTTLNIKAVILDLFAAGSDTSATALQWAMMELVRHPSAMRTAQAEVRAALAAGGHRTVNEDALAELHYLRLVIKETLRLHPPAPLLLPRECGGAVVLGRRVPRGAAVLGPPHYDAPEEFAPERFERCGRDFRGADMEFIPFGAGRRICSGMGFGLAHVELGLAALLAHFDWEMPEGMAAEEMDMGEAPGITMTPRSELVSVPITKVPVPMD